MKHSKLKLNKNKTFQTIESFGMSTAWWGKLIGGWDHLNESIMKAFYDPLDGIGLTLIRYNVGSGSSEHDYIKDPSRRTETFEVSKGNYDFTRDQNTLKLIDYALKHGCKEIVFFSISPTARMTYSNKVCGNSDPTHPSNHKEAFYQDYVDYMLDITEHFLELGYPIQYISPINEPQWEWGVKTQTQEGCYYTKEEVAKLYLLFVEEIQKRELGVRLSGPDGGEWITAIDYAKEIFQYDLLNQHMTHFDSHSYWTNKEQKLEAKNAFDHNYPSKKLVMSEWCEMKGGLDYTMDAALTLANVIHEDLSILNVVSWQYWTALEKEKYNHKVALMYIKEDTKEVLPTKKYYAFGNFTKYIRPNYQRIEASLSNDLLQVSSYYFKGQYVSVIINNNDSSVELDIEHLTVIKAIITNQDSNLEEFEYQNVIPPRSVVTLIKQEV